MPEPVAYFNGRLLPASQLALPVSDAGFVQGAAVSEQLRTFQGRLFRLEHHLARLSNSLAIVGIELGPELERLADIAAELAAQNHRLLDSGDDLGLSLFVTPGTYPTMAVAADSRPTVCLHTYPLPFSLWAEKYERGQALAITEVQQVPSACWPADLKCRSRMHYYLADRQAAAAHPGARALMLDHRGFVVEASTANIVIYCEDEGLISPPRERILPGVSVAVAEELAAQMQIPLRHRELTPSDVLQAGEAMLSSTSSCLLPAVALDGQPLGTGRPGPVFQRLLAAWSAMVGVDIPQQARRFAARV